MAVFFLSGFSCLIYQVAWQRILTLYYGVGSISITLIISLFMLGLGFGALAGGYLAEKIKNKIFLFFIIELSIACFGCLSIPFLNFLGRHTAGCSYALALFYMAVFLCIPTVLMGAALPLLIKIINRSYQKFLYNISLLYFINTLGAAVGALLTGYVIISFLGLDGAVYFASLINFLCAGLIIWSMRRPLEYHGDQADQVVGRIEDPMPRPWIYSLVFITGFLGIGYEIIWFRMAGVLVKSSPYAFSSALFVYLTGIAAGSFLIKKYSDQGKEFDAKRLFFLFQFLIGLYVAVIFAGYFHVTQNTFLSILTKISFCFTPHPPFYVPEDFLFSEARDFLAYFYIVCDVFLWPIIFFLIPTVLMGACFPLTASLALTNRNREGKTTGLVYFFNILGATSGGLATGYWILPRLGSEMALLIFSSTGLCLGFFISKIGNRPISRVQRMILIFIFLSGSVIFFPKKAELYRLMHSQQIYSSLYPEEKFEYIRHRQDNIVEYFPKKEHLYRNIPPQTISAVMEPPDGKFPRMEVEEGVEGVIVTAQLKDQVTNYIHGVRNGHRPNIDDDTAVAEVLTLASAVKNVLVVGLGTGSLAEPFLKMPGVEGVTVVEINDALVRNLKKFHYFDKFFQHQKLRLIVDDGRRFLQKDGQKYDLVLMATVRSTDAYSNNLNSQEFFRMIQRHLRPGGIYLTWIQENRVLPKTILSVFKHVRLYDTMCLASDSPFRQDIKKKEGFLSGYPAGYRKILEVQYPHRIACLGSEEYVKNKTAGYPLAKDYRPIVEYYLGYKMRKKLFIDPYPATLKESVRSEDAVE